MASGILGLDRKAVRTYFNPQDKSTVVSILPLEIREEKATLDSGVFIIPPGSYEKPSVLVVGAAVWWRDIDPKEEYLEIPVPSIVVAASIVRDYSNGLIGCNMGDRMPGLFWLPNEVSVNDVKTKHKAELDKALQKQKNWYKALLDEADSLWARSGGNPRVISSDMRLAAQELGTSKDWLKNYQASTLVRCIACGSMRNPDFPVCQHCKAIVDPDKFKKLNLAFAE